jgi:hypothetical protein
MIGVMFICAVITSILAVITNSIGVSAAAVVLGLLFAASEISSAIRAHR